MYLPSHFRRHHCTHNTVPEPIYDPSKGPDIPEDSISHGEYKAYRPDEVERPKIKRLNTVLHPEGEIDTTTTSKYVI
jgi:hypothetical protein